ncbi:MAG TPA: chemotaxis protein CheD [Spirochaetia bacterium]|nr:chemotaxis protein CheD [Spirochaetia bacterium]
MGNDVQLVKMAEIGVAENSTHLKTTLGSCVGLILHDPKRSISGLAHIVLPRKTRSDGSVGKYADTAVPALLSEMVKRGSSPSELKAYLTGGASMFPFSGDRRLTSIGDMNVEAVKAILEELRIRLTFVDTGGERGRTIVFKNLTGEILVTTLNRTGDGDKR